MDEIIVLITTGSEEEGQCIAKALVEKGAVACVNMLPGVRSIFRWEGNVVEEQEVLLMAKTVAGCFDRVASIVCANHSYQVPEIISLPIQQGNPEYLSWVREMSQGISSMGRKQEG
jgi:periplasmic divalent cation tolerance protein